MRQLCPICTRLSILVPAPMCVLPVCARSTHVFAPISTSSSSTTLPTCGIRSVRPSTKRPAEAVAADHAPGVQHDAIADAAARHQNACPDGSTPTRRRPRRRRRTRRRRSRSPHPIAARFRRTHVRRRRRRRQERRPRQPTALGWRNGPRGRGRCKAAQHFAPTRSERSRRPAAVCRRFGCERAPRPAPQPHLLSTPRRDTLRLVAKVRASPPASSTAATRSIVTLPSPTTRPPTRVGQFLQRAEHSRNVVPARCRAWASPSP